MLVRKIDGDWGEWRGTDDPFAVAVTTVRIVKDDDDNTTITAPVEQVGMQPYTKTVMLSARAVEEALRSGAWTAEDLVPFGLAVPVPFKAPNGKRAIGSARYVEIGGVVHQEFDVEDIPPPPPPPTNEEKVGRLLTDYGLTKEDLKASLADPAEVKA